MTSASSLSAVSNICRNWRSAILEKRLAAKRDRVPHSAADKTAKLAMARSIATNLARRKEMA